MDFEDYGDFGDDDLFDDKDKPAKELNDDEVLNSVIKKTEPKDGKKKRAVTMKPRPKLTEHTLTGPKGLCALRKLFEKWNPHENKSPYDNLDEMMQKIEYWGHLLYPKSNFDDLLAKIEQLGKKRAVKVYMTKLRLGMPLFEELDEKDGEKMNDRRSESPVAVDKAFSPLPDDDDDFNDEAWDKLFEEPSKKENKTKKSKNIELKKKLHKLVADSSDDDDTDEKGSKASHSDSDEMDEDSAMNLIFNEALAANKIVSTPSSSSIVKKSQNRRIILDSDDEEDEDSIPQTQASSDKENAPSRMKQPTQNKRLIIESDEDDDAEEKEAEPQISTQESETNKRAFKKSDKAQEDVPSPLSESPANKRRKIILDSDEENDDDPQQPTSTKELTEESALDFIFDD